MRTKYYLIQGGSCGQDTGFGRETDRWMHLGDAGWLLMHASVQGDELMTEVPTWFSQVSETWGGTRMGRLGSAGHNYMPLQDAIALLGMRLGVSVEIEDERAATAVAGVIQDLIYRHGWNYTMFMVVSASTRALQRLRGLDHHIKRALNVGVTSQHAAALAVAVDAYAVHAHLSRIDRALVDGCHRAGLMLFATDVGDTSHMDAVARLGVDGFASDYPERVARWRRGRNVMGTSAAMRIPADQVRLPTPSAACLPV
jgi:hypothetical protein